MARKVLIRDVVSCVLIGTIVGFGSALTLCLVFIVTPMQNVLGPRYAEFDLFVAVSVSLFTGAVTVVSAAAIAFRNLIKPRATLSRFVVCVFILAPVPVFAAFALAANGGWAWIGIIYISTCLGTLTSSRAAVFLQQRSRK